MHSIENVFYHRKFINFSRAFRFRFTFESKRETMNTSHFHCLLSITNKGEFSEGFWTYKKTQFTPQKNVSILRFQQKK